MSAPVAVRRRACLAFPADFAGFRDAARRLDAAAVPPEAVAWTVAGEAGDLFAGEAEDLPEAPAGPPRRVPAAFVALARDVACHADPARFDLLYRLLWRLRTAPRLMDELADADVARALRLRKAVRRDGHKMKAFVRFRALPDGTAEAGERFLAWFEPDHHVVERTAPFFVRRFAGQAWSILTPRRAAHWDGQRLAFGPAAVRADAPDGDPLEETWRTYYGSIFNPARLKVKAMAAEMPRKYWRNLPEARLIDPLVRQAPARAGAMVAARPLPPARSTRVRRAREREEEERRMLFTDIDTLEAVAEGVARCERCPLHRDATRGVAGEGPRDARIVMVGEQPGDREDIEGRPFVGPAGRKLDRGMAEAGIDRREVYVTNAVKHFKFEPRGKRRIHKKPDAGEIQACRWWLDNELKLIAPEIVVALGTTAVIAVLGKARSITSLRDAPVVLDTGARLFATVHPSYLLRLPDEEAKAREYARFVGDLSRIGAALAA